MSGSWPCCIHCTHQALDNQRGGHERPCECHAPRITPEAPK